MGESKRNFQEIIQDYNKSFIEHVHNEAMMYERLYDNSSKNKE